MTGLQRLRLNQSGGFETALGIPIWGEEVLVTETTPGKILMLHGNAITGLDQDISTIQPLRYMDDPTKDGSSIGSAYSYYSGMNVHHSSGVFNKAFYTLANRPGWDTRKAFDIFVKANQNYWTSSINFQQGAQGALDAAVSLGYNPADVIAAFAAVDIALGTTPTPNTSMQNGQSVIVSGNRGEWKHFTITVPSGVSVLTVKTSGGTGDADLYVKFGSQPGSYTYDCRPYIMGNNETCTTNYPSAGVHYVSLYGYESFSNVSLTASY